MTFRGTESPMDFEWQGHGPVDAASPFHRFAMDSNKKRKIGPDQWIPSSENGAGSHAQFESPNKHQLPSFGPPNGRPYFFSDVPTSPTPLASPFRAPSFTTPRKPFDVDFSSGAENSSPVEADNEETPDGRSPVQFTANNASPPKSSKRNSLFGMYGKFAPSPSRMMRPFNDALERRIHKRRRRALDKNQLARTRRDSEETSESEGDATTTISKSRRSPSKPLSFLPQEDEVQSTGSGISNFFTFLSSNPDLPSILSRYLQVLFNFALLSFFLYIIYSFYQTIRADVDRASDEAVSEVLAEMSICSKQYIDNNCAPDKRLPALEQLCSNWELCMNRRPEAVRRAALSARTFAEIFNSFIDPLTIKTVAVSLLIVVAAIFFGNAPFVLFRRQYESHHAMSHPWNQHNPGAFAGMQHIGNFAATPGLPYGHEPHTPATGRWQDPNQLAFEANQQRIEWNRSPSKEYGNRGRSRSPEKRAIS